jgi:sugar phosphate isomerase/epimerase
MGLDRLDGELTDMIEQAQVVGYRYLVLASTEPKLLESMAGIGHVCAAFRRAGELCHRHGLKFAWHPHLKDWGMVEGKRAAEHILDATDPSRVFVELDFFWASMVNVDVPRFLRRYSGRVQLGHIKDVAKGVVIPAPRSRTNTSRTWGMDSLTTDLGSRSRGRQACAIFSWSETTRPTLCRVPADRTRRCANSSQLRPSRGRYFRTQAVDSRIINL